MTQQQVTVAGLGAWLLKGNADQVDLAGRFAREPKVERWCVRPGYRARLMAAGQPVVFWASGSRGRQPYGVWGVGRLRGPALLDPDSGQYEVPLDLAVWEPARRVRRAELQADPRLAAAEVLRLPVGANPSFLTVAEFAALADHLA